MRTDGLELSKGKQVVYQWFSSYRHFVDYKMSLPLTFASLYVLRNK